MKDRVSRYGHKIERMEDDFIKSFKIVYSILLA